MNNDLEEAADRLSRWSYAHSGYHRQVSQDIDQLLEHFNDSGYGVIRVVTGPGQSLPSAASAGALVVRRGDESIADLKLGAVYVEIIGGIHAETLLEIEPALALHNGSKVSQQLSGRASEERFRSLLKAGADFEFASHALRSEVLSAIEEGVASDEAGAIANVPAETIDLWQKGINA